MGEFDVVARFYPSNAVAQLDAQYGVGGWRISGLALKLTTSDNVAGPGMFNAPGTAGQYNVCWMPNDGGWVQGNGYINQGSSSHDPVASPDNFTNLTCIGLQSTLSTNPEVVLNTLNFVKQERSFRDQFPDNDKFVLPGSAHHAQPSTWFNVPVP